MSRLLLDEEHKMEGVNGTDDYLSVVPRKGAGSDYVAIMDGPGRLETCIEFDWVEIERSNVKFYRYHGGQYRHRVKTGSIEAGSELKQFVARYQEGEDPDEYGPDETWTWCSDCGGYFDPLFLNDEGRCERCETRAYHRNKR